MMERLGMDGWLIGRELEVVILHTCFIRYGLNPLRELGVPEECMTSNNDGIVFCKVDEVVWPGPLEGIAFWLDGIPFHAVTISFVLAPPSRFTHIL